MLGIPPTPAPKSFNEANARLSKQVAPQPVIPLY